MLYIFIDPFNSKKSGITSYIKNAQHFLNNDLKIETLVISKLENETIESFRLRVGNEINIIQKEIIVEVPETLSTSKYINKRSDLKIHIRLHLSQSIGKYIQNIHYDKNEIENEQVEINRSDIVSSPSDVLFNLSTKFFKFNKEVCFFPNPIEVEETETLLEKEFDICFIGRWQNLKGIDVIEKLIKKTNYSMCILTTSEVPEYLKNIRQNVIFVIGEDQDKKYYINKSKSLLMPSIFESVGMVALEAAAQNIPIITTQNVGVLNYINKSNLFIFNKVDFKDLLDKINSALSSNKTETKAILIKNNCLFLDSLKSIIFDSEYSFYNLQFNAGNRLKMTQKSNFKRKLEKLKRDPLTFFKDIKIVKNLLKYFIGKQTIELSEKSDKHLMDSLQNITKKEIDNIKGEVQLLKKPHISPIEKIKFGELKYNKNGLSSIFIFPEGYGVLSDYIFSIIDNFSDFTYIHSKNVAKFSFSQSCYDERNALTFLNNIDLTNKKELMKINNVFLVNAPESLCLAIRSCSPTINVYNIFMYKRDYLFFDKKSITGAITLFNDDGNKFGRVLEINTLDDLPVAIRRIVQENVKKDPNFLLQIKGDVGFDETLRLNDQNKHQIIVYLTQIKSQQHRTFSELLQEIDLNMKAILVVESVYLRYKNDCEKIESGGSAFDFLSNASRDGIKFEVRFL